MYDDLNAGNKKQKVDTAQTYKRQKAEIDEAYEEVLNLDPSEESQHVFLTKPLETESQAQQEIIANSQAAIEQDEVVRLRRKERKGLFESQANDE